MRRRTQQSSELSPRVASLVEIERRAGCDLAWIVVAVIALCGVSLWVGGVDKLVDVSDKIQRWNLNGLVPLLLVTPLAASFYAWRRYLEAIGAQHELARLTVHDMLTGLPNRRSLAESFSRMLDEHRHEIGHVAVLFVDLDRFKAVNDTYGHEAGDRLMQAVAHRLRTCVKAEDVVIRYAGDEFVLLITAVPSVAVAERIASRLIKALETPFEMGADRIQISASVGIALAEDSVEEPEDVIRDADAAMYQAKVHGSGTYAVFDRSMRERLTPSTAERRLREAIERGEFHVWWQPVVSLWTRGIVGVDAVVRWEDPKRGVIPPEAFMPALDDTGLIVPVGRWLLHQACRQSREWSTAFPDRAPVSVTVDVSPRQLTQSDFVEHLQHSLAETGAHPETIVVRVDERSLVGDLGMVHQTLRAARRLGVRVAIDDAGAGLGAIGHLSDLEVDLMRIDPLSVVVLDGPGGDRALVEHVIGLAKALGIVTICTGVARPAHVELLTSLGCDLAQGEFIAPASSARALSDMLAVSDATRGTVTIRLTTSAPGR